MSGFTKHGASTDVAPRYASTVLLLRDRPAGGFEVFLVKRHGASAFMGGAYVFPGGKVDRGDAALVEGAVAERCQARLGLTPGRPRPREDTVGLYVAAIREMFEEVGVLLAHPRDGGALDEAALARIRAARAAEQPLAAIVATESLRLDLDALVPWAHWITPSLEPRRFDTHFFLARAPPSQSVEIDARETTDGVWLSPAEALAQHEAGTIVLPPPTLVNLDELARFSSIDGVMDAARARTIAAILPKRGAVGESTAILLPWDPLYVATEGEALPMSGPHPMAAAISRVVLEGERWRLGRG